jgi:hypothetical protein
LLPISGWKEKQYQGGVSLNGATIIINVNDSRSFVISNGGTKFEIMADNELRRQGWVRALERGKIETTRAKESGEWHNTCMLLACVMGFVGLYNLKLN